MVTAATAELSKREGHGEPRNHIVRYIEEASTTMVEGLLPEVTAYDIEAVTELMNSYKADGYFIGLMESGSTVTYRMT
jgi:hypothetical protein